MTTRAVTDYAEVTSMRCVRDRVNRDRYYHGKKLFIFDKGRAMLRPI
jgi:hypothetical protein